MATQWGTKVVIRWQPWLVSSNQMATQVGMYLGKQESGRRKVPRENGNLVGERATQWENGSLEVNLVRDLGKTGA